MAFKPALAEPQENDGRDDEDMDQARNHTADDRCREWFHDFGALSMAPHDWQETGDDGGDSHDLWAQSEAGSGWFVSSPIARPAIHPVVHAF